MPNMSFETRNYGGTFSEVNTEISQLGHQGSSSNSLTLTVFIINLLAGLKTQERDIRQTATVCYSKSNPGQWALVLDTPWPSLDSSRNPSTLHSDINGSPSSKVTLTCNQYTCEHGSMSYFA